MVPCRQVVRGLQSVFGTSVCGADVERGTEPAVAETERDGRGSVIAMGDIAVRNSGAVQVNVAHVVAITATDGAAEVPAVECIQPYIEGCTTIDIPVAVDVVGLTDASTGGLIVGDNVADRVAGALPSDIGIIAPMSLILGYHEAEAVFNEFGCPLLLEIGIQIGGERWLQSWITHADVQRVGVVVDVEQLGDTGLLSLSSELHLQVGLLIEAVAHVECWRNVDDRAHGVNRTT